MLLSWALPISRCLLRNQSVVAQIALKSNLKHGSVCRRGFALRGLSTDSAKDGETREVLYRGSLTTRMKAVKVFSLTTSITGIAAQPVIYEQAGKLGGTPIIVLMCGFVGFFTFVTPVLLHLITKKYVTEISYNRQNQEYTATTISLFLTKIDTKFKVSDVKVPDVPGMFTSFVAGKVPLFVEPTMFSDPEHYVKMMGYDKPIDFRLEDQKRDDQKVFTNKKQ